MDTESDTSTSHHVGAKRLKRRASTDSSAARAAASSSLEENAGAARTGTVFVTFHDGSASEPAKGAQVELPLDTTAAQLELVINDVILRTEGDALPYAVYLHDTEITASLGATVQALGSAVDTERALPLVYRPQAVFRVRAVSRCTGSMTGHSAPVVVVAFSPDGTQLVSGSGDSCVRFWDIDTATPLHCCRGHTKHIICLAWSPDGAVVASGGFDGQVLLWNPRTGKMLRQLRGHTKFITALAWEPLHATADGECRRLASSSKDATVRVWDVRAGSLLFTLGTHTASVTCLRWGGEGLIYTGSQDRRVLAWSAEKGTLVRALDGHAHWVNSMALNTDYVLRTGAFEPGPRESGGGDGSDAAAAAVTAAAAAGGDVASAGRLALRDRALQRYNKHKQACGGHERLVTGSDDFTMFLWEPTRDRKPINRMTGHQQLVNSVVYSPDGRLIASGSFDKSVRLWDGHTGKFISTLRGHVGAVYQVAFSADSRMLLSGSKDSTLKCWDPKTSKLKEDLPGHADEIYSVDWSPDGGVACSGGKDHVIKLWRA